MSGDASGIAARRVGQVLRGKWRLDRLLGVGGTAAVYAATHRNGKRGAVKLLRSELSTDPEARGRFLREGYVANRIAHPGAVAVLDDDTTEDGSVFLVMELLEGYTLEDRVREQPRRQLPANEVAYIADKLLDVLAAAHEKGVVHRDMKPENVFLTKTGDVEILDFGIARMHEAGTPGLGRATEVGSVMGTPAFMPPEQALGHTAEIGARTDLWALGAVMFYALSGRIIHEAETVNKMLLSAMTRQPPPMASIVPGLPREFCEVIDRALMFHWQQRWLDARSMQQALRQAMPSMPAVGPLVGAASEVGVVQARGALPTGSALSSDAVGGATRGGRRAVAALGAAFCFIVAGGIAVMLFMRRSGPLPSEAAAPVVTTAAPTAVVAAPPVSAATSAAPAPSAEVVGAPTASATATANKAPIAPRPTAPATSKTGKGNKDIFSEW